MYFKLKYVEGTVPGKPLKKKKDADVAQKSKEYESKRERKFNPSWKQGDPGSNTGFDEKIMKCSLCILQYGGGDGSDLNVSCSNLKGQNSFLKGCSNFRHTTISDHEKTRHTFMLTVSLKQNVHHRLWRKITKNSSDQ